MLGPPNVDRRRTRNQALLPGVRSSLRTRKHSLRRFTTPNLHQAMLRETHQMTLMSRTLQRGEGEGEAVVEDEEVQGGVEERVCRLR